MSPSRSGAAEPASDRSDTDLRRGAVGAVYVNTNKTINAVAGFTRSKDGTLTALGETATGGSGSGPAHPPALDAAKEGLDPLISANALALSRSNRFVLAVNTTSNSLTTLQVGRDFSLRATDVVFTGGQYPNSIGTHRNLVFVTNIGDPALGVRGSLTGLALTGNGRLRPIDAASAELEGRPSNVQITPDGQTLIVSELDTGNLVSFPLARDGTLGSRNTIAPDIVGEGRNIPNPIGFQIIRTQSGTFVVSTEAREVDPVIGSPPTPDTIEAGSVSSYRVSADSSLTRISNDVRAGEQVTTCWITFARPDRRHHQPGRTSPLSAPGCCRRCPHVHHRQLKRGPQLHTRDDRAAPNRSPRHSRHLTNEAVGPLTTEPPTKAADHPCLAANMAAPPKVSRAYASTSIRPTGSTHPRERNDNDQEVNQW